MLFASFTVGNEQMRVGYGNQPENLIFPVIFFNGLFEISLNTRVMRSVWRPIQNKIFWEDSRVQFRVRTEVAVGASHRGIY